MKSNLKTIITALTDADKRKRLFKAFIFAVVNLPKNLIAFSTFFILLIIFVLRLSVRFLARVPLLSKILVKLIPQSLACRSDSFCQKVINRIEAARTFKVKRYYLINLAFNNLKIKKSRSLITIFGMSVGVGIIVYLLSLGYGIERLVISKVARLDELKMADVLPGETGNVKINSRLIAKIKEIENVEKVLPVVSVVGKVDYKNAKTDILSYAVTEEYMQVLASQFLRGSYFSDKGKELTMQVGDVKGVSTQQLPKARDNEQINDATVLFNLKPEQVVPLRAQCNINAEILGYVKRLEGGYVGTEVWGGDYAPFNPFGRAAFDSVRNQYLGKWVKTKMPVYDKLPEDKLQPQLDDQGRWLWEEGCVPQSFTVVQRQLRFAQVLGEATGSAAISATNSADLNETTLNTPTNEASASALPEFEVTVVASGSGGLELVSLASTESAALTTQRAEALLKFRSLPSGKAIISSGMANYLNIPLNKAVKEKFKVSFIMVRSLLKEANGKLITQEVQYEIIGLINDDTAEYFYIPLADLERLGLQNYSQLKVVAKDKNSLKKMRHDIEVLGVTTSSTADTVAQIESLFVNIRLLLGLLGTIALGVAALGMFNTLTVSLLERTREIGGMKTMGMVSEEIQELFLSEAMIMGFAGGIGGLVLGYLMGELTSFSLSIFSLSSGVGYLNVSYVPIFLVIFILSCSFLVGLITGLYPARRAKRTSALNALRYE